MSVTLTGCVNWGTGLVEFDTDCGYCSAYEGCLVTDGGAHDGQIAVTVTTCGCSDTYYGCVNWPGGTFSVTIPDNCIGFAHKGQSLKVNVTFSGMDTCTDCFHGGGSRYYKFFDVDAGLEGGLYGTDPWPVTWNSQPTCNDCCEWQGGGFPSGFGSEFGYYRQYSTSDCSGSYSEYDIDWMILRLQRFETYLRLWGAISTGWFDYFEIFQNDIEDDCCYQALSNELACGEKGDIPYGTVTYGCITDGGIATLSVYS